MFWQKRKELPDCYVIFICDFDPIGAGNYIYTMQNICKETQEAINDGAKTIWLNTRGTCEENASRELIDFLQYVRNASKRNQTENTYKGFPKELEKSIRAIKKNRDWEAKYMLLQEMIKEAYAEGQLKLARNLLANGTDPKLVAISLEMSIEEFEKWMKEAEERVPQI